MKKIIIGVFVLTLLVSTSAYAERGRGGRDNKSEDSFATSTKSELRDRMKDKSKNASSTKDIYKNIDATCVSEAVLVREDAITSAWSAFNTDVTDVLTARKTALTNAWAITDAKERKTAVRQAWETSKKDRKSAALEYKTAKKNAWSTFKTSAKACGGSDGIEASGESESGEKVEI